LFENPFRCPGNWYRASLHTHTTDSDGDLAPAACAELYRRAGYQILAITDHWRVTEYVSNRSDFLIIGGAELDGGRSLQGTPYHIVGLNMRTRGHIERRPDAGAQDLIGLVREDGGEALVAHPYWSGLMAPEIAELAGCLAVEVYNTHCDVAIHRGVSATHWDDLLTLGHDFGAVATDDGHRREIGYARAWTMIRAQELRVEAVMEALRRGRYYCSTGPEITDLRVADGRLRVSTSPVRSIALVSQPAMGGRAFAREGGAITRAEFPLPNARYCRIEAIDREGKTAWSNPVLLAEPT